MSVTIKRGIQVKDTFIFQDVIIKGINEGKTLFELLKLNEKLENINMKLPVE